MKVVIAAGGKFHASNLAQQLNKYGYLKKILTNDFEQNENFRISNQHINNYKFGNFLDHIYFKFRLSYLIELSSWYSFKDDLFDRWLDSQLQNIGDIDIFVGWVSYWLKSLSSIKKTGSKIVAEVGSWHVLEQQKILEEEFNLAGINFSPLNKKNVEKILQEYEAADYVMVPAQHVRQSFMRQGFSSKKILYVPYGVNFEKFSRKLTIKPDKFRVIFVGQLSLQKGVQYLIKAWEKLNLPKDKTELLLVGNRQKCFDKVLKTLNVLHNVCFCGAVSQIKLKTFYDNSSLFVLPSIQDGFGMVISEAMATGLPVICTTNTGGEELIKKDKEGFILPIRDVDALAEKIMWCYENQNECFEMGKRAQEKVKNFTWDHYGEKIIETYKQILQKQ